MLETTSATAERNPYWGVEWPAVRGLFRLDAGHAHLNHGSYGAVPQQVFEVQNEWRRRMDANTTKFYRRELGPALEAARTAISGHLGADASGLTLVANATTAVCAVLGSFPLDAGDEILVTDHGYGATLMGITRACVSTGARMATISVPLNAAAEEITAAILGGVTRRTRLAVIDHVTASTGRRFPVAQIVPELRQRGIAVFVDAAHVPGMLPVDIKALAPDFWAGNLYKWAFAPRAVAALYVASKWRSAMRPLVVSWHEPDVYPHSFLQPGTADLSAVLAAPAGWELLERLGLDRVRTHNAELAAYGQAALIGALGLDAATLPSDEGLSMRVVPLPVDHGTGYDFQAVVSDTLQTETAVNNWNGQTLMRVSAHIYNAPDEYDRLADGLPALLRSVSKS